MDIWIIAVANVVLWTGLFLVMLFALMRGSRDLETRLDKLESGSKKKTKDQ